MAKNSTTSQSLKAGLVFAALAVAIACVWYYRFQERLARERVTGALSNVTHMGANRIADWQRERLKDASVLLASPAIADEINNWLLRPGETGQARILRRFRAQQNYEDILLVDTSGRVRLSLGEKISSLPSAVQHRLPAAMEQRNPTFTDVFLQESRSTPAVAVIAPVTPTTTNVPVAAIILLADFQRVLDPIASSWKAQGTSAEALLVRREGDSAEILGINPSNAPVRLSLSQTNILAVKAIMGTTGFVESQDRLGNRAMASIQKIPETSWYLIVKMNSSEIFAAWQSRFAMIVVLLLALGIAVASAVFALWQRKLAEHFRALHQAEATLRQSEHRHRIIFESIGDAVIVTDAEGRVQLLNRVAESLTGWTEEAARGKPLEEVFRIVSEDTCQPIESPVRRVLREGTIVGLANHTILIAKDGIERPIADSGAPVRDEQKQLVGVVLVFRDQTVERAAARALRDSEERFRLLAESSPIGIYLIEDRRFSYVNPALAGIFAYQPNEMVGSLGLLDLVHPDERAKVEEHRRQQLASGTDELRWEFGARRKDGSRILIEAYERRLQYHGHATIVGSLTNITERKKLEAQFLRTQRMENIGTLAGGIAHDLNNLLTPILMSTPILRSEVSNAESREILDTIERCTQRGADILRQLLTYARGTPGVNMPVPVRHLVGELRKLVTETFPRNIQFRLHVDPDLWTTTGDFSQLYQALMNLCVNARDAMPEGGTLTISAENSIVGEESTNGGEAKPGAYTCLKVIDTGTGIPPEQIDCIFDPFFTTKELGKGTGLGLATVQGIVRGHGGFIRVKSELGRGSTFELYFPSTPEIESPASFPSLPAAPKGQNQMVLVVDDEAPVRGIIQRTLTQHGYRVAIASEGADAMKQFQQYGKEISIVLTDMMMPGMDGKNLVRTLRETAPQLPIVAMTGLSDKESLDHLEALSVPVLQKPFLPDQLLAMLHRALRR